MNTELATAMVTQPECEAMIKPNGVREQLLTKISQKKINNLSKQQAQSLESQKKILLLGFYYLIDEYFTLGKTDLTDMSEKEIKSLFEMVYERAYRSTVRRRIICCCIPIVGWMILADTGVAPYYVDLVKAINKINKMVGSQSESLYDISFQIIWNDIKK